MQRLGFDLLPGEHPIIPVMLSARACRLRSSSPSAMHDDGVYVVAFSYSGRPARQARIRTQMSAAHSTPQLNRVVSAFSRAGRALGIIH